MCRISVRRSGRSSLMAAALVLTLLYWPAAAQAKWGPNDECGQRSSPNEHCYALSYRSTKYLASIAAEDTLTLEVHDWATGGFIDAEQWIWFNNENRWIETGQTAGEGYGCCTLHQFYAEQNSEGYRQWVSPGHVEGGANVYNYFLLFDGGDNGQWQIEWGCSQNSSVWCLVKTYGGWPVDFNHQEAGEEDATEIEPNESGRDEVAASDGGEWYPWRGAEYYKSPALELRSNPQDQAAGDIEWDG